MSKHRWFRFHIDRWFNGTFGLKPNEVCAYITIICELYDNEGSLKPDIQSLARRCSMRPTTFQKCLDTLIMKGKIDIEGGLLTCKTVTEELEEVSKLVQNSFKTRSKVGQNGAKNPTKSKGEKTHTEVREQNTEKKDFELFTEEEIDALSAQYPNLPVRKKLSDKGFLDWARVKNPDDPKSVLESWLFSQDRKAEQKGELSGQVFQLSDVLKRMGQ